MDKPLKISFRNIDHSDRLDGLVREKAAKMEKFCDHIIGGEVTVERPNEHPQTGSGYAVRVELHVPPEHSLVAQESSSQGDVHDTVDTVIRRAFDAMERQLKALKEQQRDEKREAEQQELGTVITVDHNDRFGIIKTPAGRDVFFRDQAVIPQKDFERIVPGSAVDYVDEPGDEGPRASTVRLVSKRGATIVDSEPDKVDLPPA